MLKGDSFPTGFHPARPSESTVVKASEASSAGTRPLEYRAPRLRTEEHASAGDRRSAFAATTSSSLLTKANALDRFRCHCGYAPVPSLNLALRDRPAWSSAVYCSTSVTRLDPSLISCFP